MSDIEIEKKARALIDKLKEKNLKLVLAESCTGGLVSSLMTDVPGASKILWGSFICYTQQAKIYMLDIDKSLLVKYGLVSLETAKAMATGALRKSGANISASITGIAGPAGDGSTVPVGTIMIAVANINGGIIAKEYNFNGTRNEIRLQAASTVLDMVDKNL